MIFRENAWFVLFTTMIVGGWSIASNGAQNPTDTGNYCKDDAITFMQKNFGDVLTFVRWENDARSGPPPFAVVVYMLHVEECSGIFVVDTGSSDFCGLASYGKRPFHVRRVFATGDCTKFLSVDMSRDEGR